MRNLCRLKKEVKRIKDIVFKNIKNLFEKEKEEENYQKPVTVNNFQSNNHIEYKSNGDRNKILSVDEYLNKLRPYLKDIKNDLKKFGPQKIQLTIAINFISSIDDSDEERVMHSKSDNIEITINDEADEVIEELSNLLKKRYRNNLQSMKDSEFVFDYVELLYNRFQKII